MDLDILKQLVKYLLSPLVSCFALLVLAIACHYTQRLRKFRTPFAYLGLGWLILSSQYAFSNWLLHPLEYQVPVIKAVDAEWRHVAFIYSPGCYYYGLDWPEASNWHNCSLTRLTQSAIMANLHNTAIIVTGGHFLEDKNVAYAEKAKLFLQLLTNSPIIALGQGTNTAEELQALFSFTGDQPIAVVTAATHMRRLTILARKAGFTQLVLVPVNHQSPPNNKWQPNLPSLSSVYATERALYEYFALAFLFLTEM